jgi:hypothetical protein
MLWFAIASRVAVASSKVDYWFCIIVAISISTVLLVSLEKVKLNLFVLESSLPCVFGFERLSQQLSPWLPTSGCLKSTECLDPTDCLAKQKTE